MLAHLIENATTITDTPDGPLGSPTPRIFTAPLRELTPETSYGFAVIDFARDVLKTPLDDWQEFVVIHGGELLPNGLPRFRTLLILVARQAGKTFLLRVLTLFWLTQERHGLILGTSTKIATAKEPWDDAVAAIETVPALSVLMPPGRGARLVGGIRDQNGRECITTLDGCRYMIAAANRSCGRGLSIDRLVLDELREQKNRDAWNAAVPATSARENAQIWCISNQGDDRSVVLNSLYQSAIEGTEDDLGLLEWSSPEGADVLDRRAWAAAQPALGGRVPFAAMNSRANTAAAQGGAVEADFRTEYLCQRVRTLNGGVNPASWARGALSGSLEGVRDKLAVCVDISPDWMHATLCAAAPVSPGVIRVQGIKEWTGPNTTKDLRNDLPALLDQLKPRTFGWFPSGPTASLTADLREPKEGRRNGWPPAGVAIVEIGAEASAACMGFAEQVNSGGVVHSGQQLLDTHILGAEKTKGVKWIFMREHGHCDAAYAAAGAVHLARTAMGKRSTRMPDLDFSSL